MDNDKIIATPAVNNKRRYSKAFEENTLQLALLEAELARLNHVKEAYLASKRQNTANGQFANPYQPIESVPHALTPNPVMVQPVHTPITPSSRTMHNAGVPPLHPPVRLTPAETAMAPTAFSPTQMQALRNRYSDSSFLTIPILLTLNYTHDEIFTTLQRRGGLQLLNILAEKDHKDLNFLTMTKYARSVKSFREGLDYYARFCQTPAYDTTLLINILKGNVVHNVQASVVSPQDNAALKPGPVHTASVHTVNTAVLMNNVSTSQPRHPLYDNPNIHYVFLPIPETTAPLHPPCYDHLAAVGSTTAYAFHNQEAHHFTLQQAESHSDQSVNEQ